MTRIAVFTPTVRYGGLDVVADGLRRQVLPEGTKVAWLVLDSCPDNRIKEIQGGFTTPLGDDGYFSLRGPALYEHMPLDDATGKSSLCAACNRAIAAAREWDADLLVSVHDYVWIPPNGLARFAEMTPADAILAGVCHHTLDPGKDAVTDPQGHFSVFAEPYHRKDRPPLSWQDCRCIPGGGVRREGPIMWEPPWAAIGRTALYDSRLYFDEEFDKAFRYENQDYAARALSLGYQVLVDSDNEAVQLPHWDYFPSEYKEHNSREMVNRELVRQRWGL